MTAYLDNLINKSAGLPDSSGPTILPISKSSSRYFEMIPRHELWQPIPFRKSEILSEGSEPRSIHIPDRAADDNSPQSSSISEDSVSELDTGFDGIDEVGEIRHEPEFQGNRAELQPSDSPPPLNLAGQIDAVKSPQPVKDIDEGISTRAQSLTDNRGSGKRLNPAKSAFIDMQKELPSRAARDIPDIDHRWFKAPVSDTVQDKSPPHDSPSAGYDKEKPKDDFPGLAETAIIGEQAARNYRRGDAFEFARKAVDQAVYLRPADRIQEPSDPNARVISSGRSAIAVMSRQKRPPIGESHTGKKIHVNIGRVEIKGARRPQQPIKTGVRDFTDHALMRLYMDGRFR